MAVFSIAARLTGNSHFYQSNPQQAYLRVNLRKAAFSFFFTARAHNEEQRGKEIKE
jgi:hypothetical protein